MKQEELSQLRRAMSDVLGGFPEVDLPLPVLGRVVTEGVLLFERDPVRRVEFETSTRRLYFDLLPFSAREGAFEKSRRSRQPRVLVALVLLLIAVGYLGVRSYYEDPLEILYAILAAGRGLVFVVGSLCVLAAMAYYYTLGIDWPLEEALRLLSIGSALGLLIWFAILGIAYFEGWLSDMWPRAWKIGTALGALAAAGWLGQRKLAVE